MTTRRGGLGRGLGALIPTAPPEPSPGGAPGTAGSAQDGTGRDGARRGPVPGDGPTAADRDLPPTEPSGAGTASPADRGSADRDSADGAGPVAAGAVLRELAPAAIRPNPRQPRQAFDEDAMAELVVSLREVGVLQPVVVRPLDASEQAGEVRYELVMGERRWRAAQLAGLPLLPAIVRGTADEAMLRDALLENLHRAQLNPLEEAAAYQQLLQEFGATHEQLASSIGRSRPQISNTIRLLQLPPAVQRRVAAGVLSAGHARALLALPDAAAQEQLATRIVAEGLSVRSVEELVAVGPGQQRPGRVSRPRSRSVDPRAEDLAVRVQDALETRVHVELGRAKSRLVVEVADLADLERVVDLIAGAAAAVEAG